MICVDIPHRFVIDDTEDRVAEQVTEAEVHPAAQQLLHDVAFQPGPSGQVGKIVELRAHAVVVEQHVGLVCEQTMRARCTLVRQFLVTLP